MISILKSYYLPPRSEGRLKSYDSCNDFRAWSLDECERSDHLFDLIKIDNDPCAGLIPKHVLVDILAEMKKNAPEEIDDGISFTAPARTEYEKPIIGDSKENEIKLKRIIAEKDSNIASLQKEIRDVKDKCDAEMKKLKESFAGEDIGGNAMAECDQIVKSLKEQIAKLQEEVNKPKEEEAKTEGFGDSEALLKEKNMKIEELERKIKEITKERDILLEQNASLTKDIDGINEHLESLSNLTMELNAYADKALLKSGKGQKYLELLEETFKLALDLDVAKAKTAAGELKIKRREYEEQIKAQLDEALDMYITALEDIQEKQLEIDRLLKELEKLKQKNDELVKKCEGAQNIQQIVKDGPEKIQKGNDKALQQEIDNLSKQLEEMKLKNEQLAKKCEERQTGQQFVKDDSNKTKTEADKQLIDKLSRQLEEMKMRNEELAKKCEERQNGQQIVKDDSDKTKTEADKQQLIDKLSIQLEEMKMKNEQLAKKCGDAKNGQQIIKDAKTEKDNQTEVDRLIKELNEMKIKYEQLARKCGDAHEAYNQDRNKNDEVLETTKQKYFPNKNNTSGTEWDVTSRYQNICQMKECNARCSQASRSQRRSCQPVICNEGRRLCISSEMDISDAPCAFCSQLNSYAPVCKPAPRTHENEAVPHLKSIRDACNEVTRKVNASGLQNDRNVKMNRIIHDNWDISLPACQPKTSNSDLTLRANRQMDLELLLQNYSLMVQIKD